MPSKRTTIYLADRDRQALRLLQARYGMASPSDVIRFALRTLAGQPERDQTAQEPSEVGVLSTGTEPGQFSPAVMQLGSQSVYRTSAAGSASVPQAEQVEILTEQLRGTQEELALTQDELARTQEELQQTNGELQTLNQEMLEMTADRNDHVPARLQELPAWKTVAETSARSVVSKHQAELMLQKYGILHTEHRLM